jgi:hypothetical protein
MRFAQVRRHAGFSVAAVLAVMDKYENDCSSCANAVRNAKGVTKEKF